MGLSGAKAVGRSGGQPHGADSFRFPFPDGDDSGPALLPQAVALALNGEHVAVVQEPVQHRGRHDGIPQHLSPGTYGLVAGDDQASLLISPADQVEQEVSPGTGQGQITQLIQDQQVVPSEVVQCRFQGTVLLCDGQLVDEVQRCDETTAITLLDSLSPQADGQVGLTNPRGSQQQDVGCIGQIPARLQLRD